MLPTEFAARQTVTQGDGLQGCRRHGLAPDRVETAHRIPAEDWQKLPKRWVNDVVDKVWAAAATDIALTETFLRTIELLDTQAVWLKPAQLKRILAAGRAEQLAP